MKKSYLHLVLTASVAIAACSGDGGSAQLNKEKEVVTTESANGFDGPVSTNGNNWQYIVTNAKRAAEIYATENNPNAVFVGNNLKTEFILQHGGKYQGRYLLKIINEHSGNISFMMLLPLFDEFLPSDDLDDEGVLWEVIEAKFNGVSF